MSQILWAGTVMARPRVGLVEHLHEYTTEACRGDRRRVWCSGDRRRSLILVYLFLFLRPQHCRAGTYVERSFGSMAGAAAKKSAAAKAATAKVYQPILGVANVAYILVYAWLGRAVSFQLAVVHLLLLGLQLYAYFGIVEDAASKPKQDDKLAGGASLDLLGAVLVLQYLGGLLHHRFYYLLGLLPIWGGWKLYSLFYGGDATKQQRIESAGAAASTPPGPASTSDKRQRRAEKRRQKWS